MSEPRRIRITHIHKMDACYSSLHLWIGQAGVFKPNSLHQYPGYYAGFFYPDSGKPIEETFFVAIRYRRI